MKKQTLLFSEKDDVKFSSYIVKIHKIYEILSLKKLSFNNKRNTTSILFFIDIRTDTHTHRDRDKKRYTFKQMIDAEMQKVIAEQGPQRVPYVEKTVLEGKKLVTIFGAYDPEPGTPEYETAYTIGKALAERGYVVVNGGYTGTMEASSKGAKEAGGESYGVVVPPLFVRRHLNGGANGYLTGAIPTHSIVERVGILASSSMYIVLPGHMGTFQELATIWNNASIDKNTGKSVAKIYAWNNPWKEFCKYTYDTIDRPGSGSIDLITFVEDADELIKLL